MGVLGHATDPAANQGDLALHCASGRWRTANSRPRGPSGRVGRRDRTREARRAGRRSLQLDGTPAFELSYWCGTCQFLFRRLEGATSTVSRRPRVGTRRRPRPHRRRSARGLRRPPSRGSYIPLLLEITPRLQVPGRDRDYFAEEQVRTWGLESFSGLPEYPRTPYYRTFETPVNADAHLYEFVVPMVPPSWNDPATVTRHAASLAESSRPTAVAVATLDVCAPAEDHGQDTTPTGGSRTSSWMATTRCRLPRKAGERCGCSRCCPWRRASPPPMTSPRSPP